MKAVIYSRCSTTHQDTEAGVAACRTEVARRGWELAGEYTDQAVSGAKTSRPALDALMSAARQGQIGAVVVPALDRLGRSAVHVLQIEQEFRRLGIALVLLRENIDGTTPIGQAMLGMFAVIAQLERSVIRARTRATMAHKRKLQGQANAAAVSDEDILALRRAEPQLSIRTIAKRLGATKSTVHAVLAAPT